jgi:putative hydrolase of the HAD superfamily
VRAVVFDLWDTLVPYPADAASTLHRDLAVRLGADEQRFVELWRATRGRREVGSLADCFRHISAILGLADANVDDAVALRREQARRLLVPRPGAVDTLNELRRRGRSIGLVTACTEDVVEFWPGTALAPLVDATVFSCVECINKPDPRIFELAAERLGVAPADCLYVGDGANDELNGAQRVGMRSVQLRLPGKDAWPGLSVAFLEHVLDLV